MVVVFFVILQALELSEHLQTCAPRVAQETMQAIVSVESGGNPFAIGVVGARLKTQPSSLKEALQIAAQLEKEGYTFSVGLSQINVKNLRKLGVSLKNAFSPCRNLSLGAQILFGCYSRAKKISSPETALTDALSCYNSGNFNTGYKRRKGGLSYVEKVLLAVRKQTTLQVPALSSQVPAFLPPFSPSKIPSQIPFVASKVKKASRPRPPASLLAIGTCSSSLFATCNKNERKKHNTQTPAATVF